MKKRYQIIPAAFFCGVFQQGGLCGAFEAGPVFPGQEQEIAAFQEAARGAWREVFFDSCTGDWTEKWFLDGEIGSVETFEGGMQLRAGPQVRNDAHHMVLWTKDLFQGDVKIEFEYTRMDLESRFVNILYIQATGSGEGPYTADITDWNELRRVPAMRMYFNHMNTYHVSFAAYGPERGGQGYIRGRRYMPDGRGLRGTDLIPDYFPPEELFAPGVPHRFTVIKREREILLRIESPDLVYHARLVNSELPPVTEGRIGLRHMFTRSALYSNFRISVCAGAREDLEKITVSPDGRNFVGAESGKQFIAWGFNYDHALGGQLIEDYWVDEWDKVEEHFAKMKALGANAVRVHLQFGQFMDTPSDPNTQSLQRLAMLVSLAEEVGLYLNITGLGCYHKEDVPQWYDDMDESQRWAAQSEFWKAVARTCSGSPAVFCYDLMNEPVFAPGAGQPKEWLAGDSLGGKYFVQRITLDNAGRSREEIAKKWVDTLVEAIREVDEETMITVGVIPWVFVFGGGRPVFYSPNVSEKLDFASVHFYPRSGEVDKAVEGLKAYDIGKPLVVEEIFSLHCSVKELDEFIDETRERVNGWFGFFWGLDIEDYNQIKAGKSDQEYSIQMAITKRWLEYFVEKTPDILGPQVDSEEGDPSGFRGSPR